MGYTTYQQKIIADKFCHNCDSVSPIARIILSILELTQPLDGYLFD